MQVAIELMHIVYSLKTGELLSLLLAMANLRISIVQEAHIWDVQNAADLYFFKSVIYWTTKLFIGLFS